MSIRGRVRPTVAAVLGSVLVALLATACGGGSTDATPTATSEPASTAAAPTATQPPTVAATAAPQQPNAEARVSSSDGKATLLIPEGALPDGVSASDVSVVAIPAFTEDTDEIRVIADYELLPDGLELLKPVVLEVPIPDDLGAALLFVIHISGETVEFPLPEVVFDEETGSATMLVELTHFSNLRFLANLAARDLEGDYVVDILIDPPERVVGESFPIAVQPPTFREVTFLDTERNRWTVRASTVNIQTSYMKILWLTPWLEYVSSPAESEAETTVTPLDVAFRTIDSFIELPLVAELRCLSVKRGGIGVSGNTFAEVSFTNSANETRSFRRIRLSSFFPLGGSGVTMMTCTADSPTETPPTETPVPEPPPDEPPPPEPPGTVSGTVNIGGTEITAEITTNVPGGTNVEATVCQSEDGVPVTGKKTFLTVAPKGETPASPKAVHQNDFSDGTGCAYFFLSLGGGTWNAYTGLEGTSEVAKFGFEFEVCDQVC